MKGCEAGYEIVEILQKRKQGSKLK